MQSSLLAPRGALGVQCRLVDHLQRQPRLLPKGLARGGQGQTAVSAGEEHHPQTLLELFDLLAEGGLGDMQPLRRPVHM